MKDVQNNSASLTRRTMIQSVGAVGGALAIPHFVTGPAFPQSDRHGGALRVTTNTQFTTLSPIRHLSNPEFTATKWMYSNLTRLNDKLEVQPDLAKSWEPQDDGRVWVFHLRKGAKFHNGREVTSDDVVATFNAVLDPRNASPYRAELGPIQQVEAVDDYTVKFTLRTPFAYLATSLSSVSGRIIAKEGLENLDALATAEFGSGPFKLKEFVPGDRVVVERFENYFEPGLPFLDSASIKTYPEALIEMNALVAGESDLIIRVEPELFSQLQTASKVDTMRIPSATHPGLVVPCDKPPFNDNLVREALKYTVDRSLVLAGAADSFGEVGHDHPISSVYPAYEAMTERPRDIEKAKALLAEAGYPDGLSFRVYAAVSPPLREKLAVILKEMARPAGFDITIEVVSYDRFLTQIWKKGVPYIIYYNTRPTEDAILMKLYHPEEGVDEGEWASSNPDAIKLLERARATLDPAIRKQLYAEFNDISRNTGPFIITFFTDELSVKGNYVMDYSPPPNTFDIDIARVWLTSDAPTRNR